MNDTTIFSTKESTTCTILSLMDKHIICCRMKFNPQKTRSLSLRKAKVNQNINFLVGGQSILTVSKEPVKSLGRWFDESLKDINQTKKYPELDEKVSISITVHY